jgi:hypothetical protein
MATERPVSRLPDGKVNPEYTAWRKSQILDKPKPGATPNVSQNKPESNTTTEHGEELPEIEHVAPETLPDEMDSDTGLSPNPAPDFQIAAEPEQTTIGDPREPEVAPDLESIKIRVDRPARNKTFVYGSLDGELVPIRIKKGLGSKLVGKEIPVSVTVEAGHTLYIHTP